MDKDKIQQKYMELQLLDNQIKEMHQQVQAFETQADEIAAIIEGLKDLGVTKSPLLDNIEKSIDNYEGKVVKQSKKYFNSKLRLNHYINWGLCYETSNYFCNYSNS